MSEHTANIVQMGRLHAGIPLTQARLVTDEKRMVGADVGTTTTTLLPILFAGSLPRFQDVHTLWVRGHVHLSTPKTGRIPVAIRYLTCRRHPDQAPPQCCPCIRGS